MTDTNAAEAAKSKADALFKTQQLLDGAAIDRRPDAVAKLTEADKTAKLRTLRLAKERSDQIAVEVRKTRRALKRPS